MKKQLLFLFFTIISFNFYAQDDFEKGFFIDNDGQQVECFIKKNKGNTNPIEFEYKVSENAEIKIATIDSVKEFSHGDYLKYVRVTTKIDRSSEILSKLSNQRAPEFKEEVLFLKVLVEGKANLYEYTDNNLRRFFYKKDNAELKQLIYKSFKVNQGTVSKNNRYRQQLWNELKCPNFTSNRVERVDYKKKNLIKYFTDYSECNDVEYVTYQPNKKESLFSFSVRPRITNNSLTVGSQNSNITDADFGSKIGLSIGFEVEYALPFNFNKEHKNWTVTVEPIYNRFTANTSTHDTGSSNLDVIHSSLEYNTFDVPISLRRYFNVGKKSKLFVNASYAFTLHLNSSYLLRDDEQALNVSNGFRGGSFFAFGVGYKYNEKYSLELRLDSTRDIFKDYEYRTSKYKSISVIFGYTLF
ncbi:MAG: tRNA modification GTPase [Bacteroidota bacterium]